MCYVFITLCVDLLMLAMLKNSIAGVENIQVENVLNLEMLSVYGYVHILFLLKLEFI